MRPRVGAESEQICQEVAFRSTVLQMSPVLTMLVVQSFSLLFGATRTGFLARVLCFVSTLPSCYVQILKSGDKPQNIMQRPKNPFGMSICVLMRRLITVPYLWPVWSCDFVSTWHSHKSTFVWQDQWKSMCCLGLGSVLVPNRTCCRSPQRSRRL